MTNKLKNLYREIFSHINGDQETVLQLCESYIKRDETNINVWKIYANCTKKLDEHEKCLTATRRIIELGEVSEQALTYCLTMASKTANPFEAKQAAIKAEQVFQSPEALFCLSQISNQFDLSEISYSATKKLLKIDSKNPALWDLLGTASQFMGKLDEAEKHFKKAIEMGGPSQSHSMYMLSMLKKWSAEDNNCEQLRSKVAANKTEDKDYPSLAYSLAKELEDSKDYDESFTWYQKGANVMRSRGNYNVETDRQLFNALKKFSSKSGDNGAASKLTPIFILGLPRTGSTLIERVVSSHSLVESFGETSSLLSSFKSTLGIKHHNPETFIEDLAQTESFNFAEFGEKYLEKLHGNNRNNGYFIEKLPMNMYFCGVLLRAFPHAKIIYTDRNPLDTCLSNYKQIFAPNAWPYSYDLVEIADQYLLANENANYWASLYPENVTKIAYEDLVSAPENTIDEILNFCGLKHEEACYHPEKNKLSSSTASSSQVRKPINKGSLHKWKKFEKHFQEVKAYLESKGVVTE